MRRAGIGVLTWVVAPGLVDEAVGAGQARERRLRSLPSRLGVYFVLGLCLFSHLPYGQVLRELTSGLEAGLAAAGWQVPATTALTAVRRRIGEEPLESLFRRLCPGVLAGQARWSHVCGLLAVARDGTTVAAGNTPPNTAAFGKPGRGPKRSAASRPDEQQAAARYPQLRLVTLVACGTRALLGAALGPVRGKGTGEQALARELLGSLRPGMLLLADRNFYGYDLWQAAAGTGADLLWRVKGSMHLPVVAELPDGSWLTHINDPRAVRARLARNGMRRRRGSKLPPQTGPLPGITARVIQYALTITTDDGQARTEQYRHLTTLTDWRACPAAELAAGYASAVGSRDRVPGIQDLPARARPRPARPDPRHLGPPGTMGLPDHLPRRSASSSPAPPGQRRPGPRPDLLHRHAARHPPHHPRRPRQHHRRASRHRSRDPDLPHPPPRRPHQPPRSDQAILPLPLPAQPQRTHITTRQVHPHHHHPPPDHTHHH